MSSHAPFPPSRSLLARLDREWRVLSHRPAVLARAGGWHLGISFRSLDEIVAATGFWVRREERLAAGAADEAGPSGDEVLAGLLLAARADDLAARVVLQRLLPGIVTRARHWSARSGGTPEALDELLAAAWGVIRTYPVERRDRHLAANLLRDAEYHAFVRSTRRLAVQEPTEPRLMDLPVEVVEPVDSAAELAELVAAATALSERDLQLVRLLVRGTPVKEVAQAMDVSVRTVANHRDALVSRLRQTARELAAA